MVHYATNEEPTGPLRRTMSLPVLTVFIAVKK